MKFITPRELNIALSECSLDEISSYKHRLVEQAEIFSIETIKGYLNSVYDMTFELRAFKEFKHSTVYKDFDRVRISNNQDNHIFGTNCNVELIDNIYWESTTGEVVPNCLYSNFDKFEDLDNDEILVKINNTCPSEYVQKGVTSFYEQQEYYTNEKNPLYDENCGIIVGTDGVYTSNQILEYYNSIYTTSGIVPIDYNNLTVAQIADYHNINYFDQYLLSNKERDFSIDDRNPILIQLTIDILIYTLLQRVSPRMISEMNKTRYEDAIELLKQIQNGEFSLDLKKYPNSKEFQNNLSVRFGWSEQGGKYKY